MEVMQFNDTEIPIHGLQRSGNHAVMNWIASQSIGICVILNDRKPGTNPFETMEEYCEYYDGCPGSLQYTWDAPARRLASSHTPARRRVPIHSYEDRESSSHRVSESWIGRSTSHFDVLIIHDALNLFASRLRVWNLQTGIKDRHLIVELWKQYAREALGITSVLNPPHTVVVDFGKWKKDKEYRRHFALTLGFQFSDSGIDSMLKIDPEHLFDGFDFSIEASKMAVNERRKSVVQDSKFKSIVSDSELQDLSVRFLGQQACWKEISELKELILGESPQANKRGISDSADTKISPSEVVTGCATFAETVAVEFKEGESSNSFVPRELRRELREWELTGRKARFWWRDDDAVSDTPALRRLLALAEEIETVVALAVIPGPADYGLVKLVASAPACIWQHGWRHQWQHEDGAHGYSHGEFGEGRDLESMMADAHNGQIVLDRIFGNAGWQRVFVPPFHALSVPFKMLLPSLGYWGLSAGLPRTLPIDTVAEVNAEVDIMGWLERKAHGLDVISKMLVEQLVSRRQGHIPVRSPIGLLTHHLAHDEEAWRCVTELLRFLKRETAVEIVPADLLFDQPKANPPGPSCRASSHGAESIGHNEITMVVTSCGRQDLLETTLDSFMRCNTFPIKEIIVIEDGDGAKNHALMEKYCRYPFKWLATDQRVGQVAAIDIAYQQVRTELIFHCEDDWEFFSPGFIEKSLAVLDHNHSILQVWIRALNDTNECPVLDYTLTEAGIPYRLFRHHHDDGKWGIWHGFSWNPGLRRRRDYRLLGSFASLDPEKTKRSWQVESQASAFYQQRGFFAAILADNEGRGYVRHTGWGRRIPHDYLAPLLSAPHSAETTTSSESVAAVRDHHAQLLMARLAAHPRFGRLCHDCGRENNPGIDELPEWQIWTNQATTADQLAIEEQLENFVTASSSILHIGAGNSSLGRRFAPRVSTVVGTTLHDEERVLSEGLGIENYAVVCANKYSEDMDRIAGNFDFIVDNNPSSFACCLFHFSRMMVSYAELLKRDGGLFMTAQRGWGWVVTANDLNWSFGWDDWALLGEILRMPVARVTDMVYSMQRLPDSVSASMLNELPGRSSASDVHDMQHAAREAERLGQIRELTSALGSARARAAEQEIQARRASAEITSAKQAAAALQAELDAVYASWSWGITKPLRSIGARYPGLMRLGLELLAFASRLRPRISRAPKSRWGR
jgi:hypothetical protein